MKIKKSAKAAPAIHVTGGGATIADRFKLDQTAMGKAKGGSTSKGAATAALIAAFIALAVAGGLVYMLFDHLDFLSKV